MAIQNYIGWHSYVNRIILDATTITIGENAIRQDEALSGIRRSVLKGLFAPEKYSVTMEFDWETVDARTGKTELQMFYEWYKYEHRYGTVPFEFPQILYSPLTGITGIDEKTSSGRRKLLTNKTEYYKITSTVEGSKKGSSIQIRMTWENVYGGQITVQEPVRNITSISTNGAVGYVEAVFSEIGTTIPVRTNFHIYIDGSETETECTGFFYDNGYICRLYFDLDSLTATENDAHSLTISYSDSSYTLAKGTYTSEFVVGDSDGQYYTQDGE